MGAEFLFMDDNARPLSANIVDECLQSEDITRMDLPAYSPDLNPIEHISFLGMNKIRKTTEGLDFTILLSEELVEIDDDNVCTVPILADKDIFGFVQSSKNIIDTDSDNEELNYDVPVPTSFKMRNIMKSMFNYIDAHYNGKMNTKMDDIEQLVDNLILKNDAQREISSYFS
ncbi:DDE-1 domain-containing protein [Trichonephila clavipes]|nr:DDE-1 domain-containing protein [Trichonephila clavipes]